MSQQLRPFYENIQAHYDLSNEYFKLFLDPSMTYSCAYFQRDDMTLAEAQQAKFDLALDKIDLRPGQKLLDIGCGWGASSRRAAERFDVDVVALTLSRAQNEFARDRLAREPVRAGRIDFRLQGWEEYFEPVDRIVCIAAFEAFRRERYDAFFQRCRDLLPGDGRMLLHTIVWFSPQTYESRGITLTHEDIQFFKFVNKQIFVDGELCPPETVVQHAEKVGFRVTRIDKLGLHYARTLDLWAENLSAARDRAIELQGQETYDKFMRYLTGCSRYFRSGHIDVMQFTLEV